MQRKAEAWIFSGIRGASKDSTFIEIQVLFDFSLLHSVDLRLSFHLYISVPPFPLNMSQPSKKPPPQSLSSECYITSDAY